MLGKIRMPVPLDFGPAKERTTRLWFKYKKGTLTNSIPKGWKKKPLKKQEALWKTRTKRPS